MAIQNEVFKFVAEIELDEKTTQEFTAALKVANDHCDELRQTIAKNQKELMRMSAAGKENTEEYKALKKEIAENTANLKKSSEQANKYASALGVNKMTANQLKGYIKRLKAEMDSLHKDVDPTLWNKYNDKLKAAQRRMKELEGGIKNTGGVMELLQSKWGKIAGWAAVATKVFSAIYGGLERMSQETQSWGDKWQMAHTMVSAGWNQLLANIGQGKNVIKASIREALEAAREAQSVFDELFERNNSLMLEESDIRIQVSEQMAIIKDTSKSQEERLAAIDKVLDLENKLAARKSQIYGDERQQYLDLLSVRTQLADFELERIIDNYNANRENIKRAEEYNKLLEERTRLESSKDLAAATDAVSAARSGGISMPMSGVDYDAEIDKIGRLMAEMEYAYPNVEEWARYLRQYNLANDEFVNNYVQATLKWKAAAHAQKKGEEEMAARKGELVNKMRAANKAATDKAYSDAVENAETTARVELNALKEQLLKKEITQEEFNKKSEDIELRRLEKLKDINKKYGKDITAIDGQILDKRLQAQNGGTSSATDSSNMPPIKPLESLYFAGKAESEPSGGLAFTLPSKSFEEDLATLEILYQQGIASEQRYLLEKSKIRAKYGKSNLETEKALMEMSLAALEKQHEAGKIKEEDYQREKQAIVLRYLESTGDPATESFKSEFAALDAAYGNGLISWEEYLIKRNELFEKYNGQASAASKTLWEKGAEGALQGTLTMLNAASEMVNSIKEAELAQLDAQKEKELAAAGDNAEKRAAIEEEYEAKKLDTQKKYADVEMGINIATALAQGALAVIQAWAQLGPIAGSIFAAIVAATTAAQIAVMVQQRNAIKNSSASGGSGSTTTRVVNGYSEGGYTGDGGRLEVAGVVHRGEYVVPQPELRDPAVAAMVASIESRRRRRTSANALPGFAEGGYTGATSGGRHTDELLDKILVAIERGNSTPAKAYVVLSDLNEKQKQQSRMNKKSSLRPRP